MNNQKLITREFFEHSPDIWEHYASQEKLLRDVHGPDYVCYVSRTAEIQENYKQFEYTVVIDNCTNMGEGWWSIHIDNGDMSSVASFAARTLEQANRVLSLYDMRLGEHILYFKSHWDANTIIAETALPLVTRLYKEAVGQPRDLTMKQWKHILAKIIFSLHVYAHEGFIFQTFDWFHRMFPWEKDVDCDKQKHRVYYNNFCARLDEGMRLFAEWFPDLWD